jgi:hypothetical protein
MATSIVSDSLQSTCNERNANNQEAQLNQVFSDQSALSRRAIFSLFPLVTLFHIGNR